MNTVIIHRDWQDDNESLGVCYVKDSSGKIVLKKESIERGWLDNKPNISCIPTGEYILRLEYSPRFRKNLWEIYGVPNRSECKFHAANYWTQLNGCISLGNKRVDLNKDGYKDVTSSRLAMSEFHKVMKGKEAILIVKNI